MKLVSESLLVIVGVVYQHHVIFKQNKMATESVSDEWMYNEVLDDEMPEVCLFNHSLINV